MPQPAQKTGMWSDEENNQLFAGLKIHGKDWDALATLIPTRNIKQIKCRCSTISTEAIDRKGAVARVSLSPSSSSSSRLNVTNGAVKSVGTTKKNHVLVVGDKKQHPAQDTSYVGQNLGKVNSSQSRKNAAPRRDWTEEEENLIRVGLQQHGSNWDEVVKVVKSRDRKQVRKHTKVLEKKGEVTIKADGRVTIHQVSINKKRSAADNIKNTSNKKQRKSPTKTITILGATGGTGLCLVKQALTAGYEVKALVRNPNKFTFELSMNKNFTVIKGDVTDYDDVKAALVNSTDVIVSLGGGGGKDGKICSTAQPVIDRALNDTNPNMRLVVITSMAAGDSYYDCSWMARRFADFFLASAIKDKNLQERSVIKNTSNWVIVRPVGLSNGPKTGTAQGGPHVAPAASKAIARADVADFILKRCLSGNDEWKRNPVTVFPPQKM